MVRFDNYRAAWQAVTRGKIEQASKATMGEPTRRARDTAIRYYDLYTKQVEANLFLAPGEGGEEPAPEEGAGAQQRQAGNVLSDAVRLIRG